jgi:hypothetical protein
MNETEYLQKQAADARAAIGGTARELLGDVEHAVDPRRAWRRLKAQLWVFGAAVAAAGIAGSALMGRVRSTNGVAKESRKPSSVPPEDRAKAARKADSILPLVTEILALARPVIAAVATISAARAKTSESNGHAATARKPPRAPRTRKRSS